jgi:hypothetical protein
MQQITNYSKKDIQEIVKEEVEKRFYSFERLLNSLKNKVDDLDKIVQLRFNRNERRLKK